MGLCKDIHSPICYLFFIQVQEKTSGLHAVPNGKVLPHSGLKIENFQGREDRYQWSSVLLRLSLFLPT